MVGLAEIKTINVKKVYPQAKKNGLSCRQAGKKASFRISERVI